ncbi:MAG: DUF362 domain-containing protein [Myxococcota bacterium]
MSERGRDTTDLLTRREFLEATGAAASLAALGLGCDDPAGGVTRDQGGAAVADGGADGGEDLSIPQGKAVVGIAHRDNVEEAVRRAITLAGGLTIIEAGQTVFIKPNAVHPYVQGFSGVVTSSAVLAAVVRAVKERKPSRIVVGDRSARGFSTDLAFSNTGLRDAALEAGADEVFAALPPADAPDDWLLLQPPAWEETWKEKGGILAMRRIVESDHLIDLPVCKDHRWAVFSLSMKNLIGAVGDDSRDFMHYKSRMPNRLSRDVAILNQMFTPTLSIIDAWDSVINGGPEGILGDAVRVEPRLILASRDRLALDAAGASLLALELGRTKVPQPDEAYAFLTAGKSPWSLPQIVHGVERGLGVDGPNRAILRFDDVADAAALEKIFRS